MTRYPLAPPNRTSFLPYAFGATTALGIGIAAHHLYSLGIALLTLAPLVAHIRHVGGRNILSEPNAITVIVLFYLFIFPLRGLVIALSGYTDLVVVRGPITAGVLASELLLASASTTALVEAYYFVNRSRGTRAVVVATNSAEHDAIVQLTRLLVGVSLASLAGVIVEHGGISGARAAFASHSKAGTVVGSSRVLGGTWDLFAVPALWCCAYSAFYASASRHTRTMCLMSSAAIIAGDLFIYGSRLNTLLGVIGVWIVYLYSGRRLSAPLVIIALLLAVVLSQPILESRGGATIHAPVSIWERYSRIASYGVLDVSLAVRSDRQQIRAQDTAAKRWLDLPGYFVPSLIWRGRPNLASSRLDSYVAQDVGSANDANTGFPTTYITEAWLIGGWLGAVIYSSVCGVLLGWASRRLTGGASLTPVALLTYVLVVTVAWSYYKDGDLLTSFVGQMHRAIYFLALLWIAKAFAGKQQPVAPPLIANTGSTRAHTV